MKKQILPALLSFVIIFSFGALLVHAQGTNSGGTSGVPSNGGGTTGVAPGSGVSIQLENPFKGTGTNSLPELFTAILNGVVLPIGGVLCVLAFVYAGFLYVTAGGNSSKVGAANNMLKNAAIGTAILLGASTIALVIENTVKAFQTT